METRNMGAALVGVDLFSDKKVLDAPKKYFLEVQKPKKAGKKKGSESEMQVEEEGQGEVDEAGMVVIPDDPVVHSLHTLSLGKPKPFIILRNVPRDNTPLKVGKPRRKITLNIKDNAETRWKQKVISTGV